LAIDPNCSLALHVVAGVQFQHVLFGTAPDAAAAWQAGYSAVNQAIAAGRNDSDAYAIKAFLLCCSADRQRADEDLPNAQRAYELNPNNMWAVMAIAHSLLCAGAPDEAITYFHRAMRLNPRDPLRCNTFQLLSAAHLLWGDYGRGVESARLGLADAPDLPQLHGYLAMNLVGMGNIAMGKAACDEARRLAPGWVERGQAGRFVYRKPEHLRRVTTFMRIAAGLDDPSAADALR
jgi:tetratricopeptide (TPR) repeat protein